MPQHLTHNNPPNVCRKVTTPFSQLPTRRSRDENRASIAKRSLIISASSFPPIFGSWHERGIVLIDNLSAPGSGASGGKTFVDADRLADDVARLSLIEQKSRCTGKLLRLAITPLRSHAQPFGTHVLGVHVPDHRHLNGDRSNHIDPDPVESQFDRHDPGHSKYRGFRGAIGQASESAAETRYRRDVDDRATSTRAHPPRRRAGSDEGAN